MEAYLELCERESLWQKGVVLSCDRERVGRLEAMHRVALWGVVGLSVCAPAVTGEVVEIFVGRRSSEGGADLGGGGFGSAWCPGDATATAVLAEFAARSSAPYVVVLGGRAGFGNEVDQVWHAFLAALVSGATLGIDMTRSRTLRWLAPDARLVRARRPRVRRDRRAPRPGARRGRPVGARQASAQSMALKIAHSKAPFQQGEIAWPLAWQA